MTTSSEGLPTPTQPPAPGSELHAVAAHGSGQYWLERYRAKASQYDELFGQYMDMQRILAALIKQQGGQAQVYGSTMAELPRLAYIHAMKTGGGGMHLAVTEVPE